MNINNKFEINFIIIINNWWLVNKSLELINWNCKFYNLNINLNR